MYGIKEIDSETLKIWKEKGKSLRLIDVRSQAEMMQGMIQDGEALPLHLLPVKTADLEGDHDVIFYCRTGARSAQACAYMVQNGFDRAYNLRGGIMGWVRSGNQVIQGAL